MNISKGDRDNRYTINASYRCVSLAILVVLFLVCRVIGFEDPISHNSETERKEFQNLKSNILERLIGLGYSENNSHMIVDMISNWKDLLDRHCLEVYLKEIDKARHDYDRQVINQKEYAKKEEDIANKLMNRIIHEIESIEGTQSISMLDEVTELKKTNCLGFTQLFWAIGNSMGLNVQPIKVTKMYEESLPAKCGHIACIVLLKDDNYMMVDLQNSMISDPFVLKDQFNLQDNHWLIKDKNNPLKLHPNFDILKRNEWLSIIIYARGSSYFDTNKFNLAAEYYSKSIQLDPKLSEAYNSRAIVFIKLNQLKKALNDFDDAIKLAPTNEYYYLDRGGANYLLKDYKSALSDCTTAINLNPDNALAYFHRGKVYYSCNQFQSSIDDLTKAIELGSQDGNTFLLRGKVYCKLSDFSKAENDFKKAEELNPRLRKTILNIKYNFIKKRTNE